MMKSVHCMVALATAVILVSCKLRIVVPEGGEVISESGAYSCAWGECDVDVVDFYFDETFLARPGHGYKFEGWRQGDRLLCAGERSNTESCRVSTAEFKGNAELMETVQGFLESDEVFYIEPIFVAECSALVPGNKSKFTLRQGEHTVRELRIPADTDKDSDTSIYTEITGCPSGVCSSRTISHGPKYDLDELIFSPTPRTPPGSYKIQYVAYKGRLVWFLGGVFYWPDKAVKRWKFTLTVAECPD